MDNMQRAMLVRRFLLLLGDLHAHQLRPKSKSTNGQDKKLRPYKSDENSWYPIVPEMLFDEVTAADSSADELMKQAKSVISVRVFAPERGYPDASACRPAGKKQSRCHTESVLPSA